MASAKDQKLQQLGIDEIWPIIMDQLRLLSRLPGSALFNINYSSRPFGNKASDLGRVTIDLAGFLKHTRRVALKSKYNLARVIIEGLRPVIEQYGRMKAATALGAQWPTFVI